MSKIHTKRELLEMQSLPLDIKIRMTQRRIREWYNGWNGDIYVAFSGGIDSTVLKHLVDSMYNDVPSVFVDTGLEYPEIRQFISRIQKGAHPEFSQNVAIVRPSLSFTEVVKQYGYPVISKEVANTISGARRSLDKGRWSLRLCKLGVKRGDYGGLEWDGKHDYEKALKNSKFQLNKWRFLLDAPFKISHLCCDVMKKQPLHRYEKQTGRKAMIGTLATESMNRETAWLKNGCNVFDGEDPKSTPLAFWTHQDILEYIRQRNLPFASVYGEVTGTSGNLSTTGCDRTGCIYCMFGCHLEKGLNRFQKLKETHPKHWDYCINGGEFQDGIWQPSKKGLGLNFVLDFLRIPFE